MGLYNMMYISRMSYWLFNRLNAVREICNRCPLAISEDLLQDLVMYKTHKDKGMSVVMYVDRYFHFL